MAFEVVPSSLPVYREDRLRAMHAPLSELPELTEVQSSEVRAFSLKEEDYKRLRVLPRKYVLERQQRDGTEFGRWVERAFIPLGNRFQLESVSREGAPKGWIVTVRDSQRSVVRFECPLGVVEAIVNGTASERQETGLREDILAELVQGQALEAAG